MNKLSKLELIQNPTFQDALDITGETLEQFNKRTEHDDDQERASKELAVIFKAINEGEKGIYYPRFYNPTGSGSSFSSRGYVYGDVYSIVGGRYKASTPAKARYVGKKFTSIFNRYING